MKKFIRTFLFLAIVAVASPVSSFATDVTTPVVDPNALRAQQLTQRLEEIKSMDATKMTKDQKRVLRKEVKAIKKEMAAISGGVYLSVGALILVILLLILLL